MINALIILSFLIYSTLLFFINNTKVTILLIIINLILLITSKCNLKNYLKFLYKNIIFVIFIFLCNIMYETLTNSLLISIKLLLILNLTYIISTKLTPSNFSDAFYHLFYPLKLLKVDIKKLSLIITISLSFIPILMDEAKKIKLALQSKGFEFNLKNVITKPHIFLITYLNNLFTRVDELEHTLIMKAYE